MTKEASPFKEASWFHWTADVSVRKVTKSEWKDEVKYALLNWVSLKRRIVCYQIQSYLEPCTAAFALWSCASCWDAGLDLGSHRPSRPCIDLGWSFISDFFLTLPFAVIWNYGWNPCIKYWLFLLYGSRNRYFFFKCPILGIDSCVKVKWTKWSWKITKYSVGRDLRENQSLRVRCGQSELCRARSATPHSSLPGSSTSRSSKQNVRLLVLKEK